MYKLKKNIALFLAAACLPLLVSLPVYAGSPAIHYNVRFDAYPGNKIDVSLEIAGWPADTLLLHGVPIYMNNPTAAADTQVVWGLNATNDEGKSLVIEAGEPDEFGQVAHTVRGCRGDLRIDYELLVQYRTSDQTKQYSVVLPDFNSKNTWLNGNYVFCHPRLHADMPRSIRTPLPITIGFEGPDNASLAGVADRIELNNIYELMSLQFGVGDFYIETRTAGHVEYTIILDDNLSFNTAERAALHDLTGNSISAIGDIFGGVPFDRFAVYFKRHTGRGAGLEGSNACQVMIVDSLDITNTDDHNVRVFYLVTLHELFHTWNPIFLFALEDHWVKEGFSCYYDGVLSARLGYITDEDVDRRLDRYFDLLDENTLFNEIPLTDPRLWYKEYDGENWRTLTYDRGQAVALLLDVYIREKTDNERSLDDVMRALYQEFVFDSYDHEEFLATIEKSIGINVGEFFTEYVETARAPSGKEVRRALEKAKGLGVFTRGRTR